MIYERVSHIATGLRDNRGGALSELTVTVSDEGVQIGLYGIDRVVYLMRVC